MGVYEHEWFDTEQVWHNQMQVICQSLSLPPADPGLRSQWLSLYGEGKRGSTHFPSLWLWAYTAKALTNELQLFEVFQISFSCFRAKSIVIEKLNFFWKKVLVSHTHMQMNNETNL